MAFGKVGALVAASLVNSIECIKVHGANFSRSHSWHVRRSASIRRAFAAGELDPYMRDPRRVKSDGARGDSAIVDYGKLRQNRESEFRPICEEYMSGLNDDTFQPSNAMLRLITTIGGRIGNFWYKDEDNFKADMDTIKEVFDLIKKDDYKEALEKSKSVSGEFSPTWQMQFGNRNNWAFY